MYQMPQFAYYSGLRGIPYHTEFHHQQENALGHPSIRLDLCNNVQIGCGYCDNQIIDRAEIQSSNLTV